MPTKTKEYPHTQSIMRPSMKIGLIAGSFDIIHPGYVKMFEDAKTNACNHLIVALQGDPTIERPEKCKPVQTVEEREYILMSIKYVDKVVHYNTEKELLEIVKKLDYDIRIIGSDYRNIDFTGRSDEKEIYYHERHHDYSLTKLKNKITNQVLKQKNV